MTTVHGIPVQYIPGTMLANLDPENNRVSDFEQLIAKWGND